MGHNTRWIVIAGFLILWCLSACARLGPTLESETVHSGVTVDSLKTAVRDSQRVTADLRMELTDRRKELADVHVARAQLQGMLRDTERRLDEARHIIELQRDELEAVRADRERVEESGRRRQSRVRRLEKLLAQARSGNEIGSAIPSVYGPCRSGESPQPLHVSSPGSPVVTQAVMAAQAHAPNSVSASEERQQDSGSLRIVVVREGETLWRLARRHQVEVEELRQLNGLRDDRIVTGWTLRLPAGAHVAGLPASGLRRFVR